MPSFDIVSEVDPQEIDNAINQARKELATRFDFKGSTAEIIAEKDKITLSAEDASRLRGLREIVIGKLSKRGVDLRNIEQVEPAISPLGHARQELKIQQGLEGDKAKEIIHAIKGQNFKVQSQLQERQIRVTGKKRDDLQAVIAFVRGRDFGDAPLEIEASRQFLARLIQGVINLLRVHFRNDVERRHDGNFRF